MNTAKKYLQSQYPQLRGDNWNKHSHIDDDKLASLLKEYAEYHHSEKLAELAGNEVSDEAIEASSRYESEYNDSEQINWINGAIWMRTIMSAKLAEKQKEVEEWQHNAYKAAQELGDEVNELNRKPE